MGSRDWRLFVYGGLASIIAESGTFPIDTTKTRLQIQGQKLDCKHGELKYRGMLNCMLRISKEEGLRALYSGMSPALLRQASYGTIKFGTYYWLQSLFQKTEGEQATTSGLARNVGCAVVAGVLASSIANPTDVLKVRMQADRTKLMKGGLVQSFLDVYHLEGIRGLWRGVGPTAQRAAVIAAVELPVYDMCKHAFMDRLGDSITNHFSASLVASFGSAIASTPIDVIRTRLMNQRRFKAHTTAGIAAEAAPHIYSGSIDCFVQTVRNEGIMALYKGFIPTFVRMGPWNIIFFTTFEQFKKLY